MVFHLSCVVVFHLLPPFFQPWFYAEKFFLFLQKMVAAREVGLELEPTLPPLLLPILTSVNIKIKLNKYLKETKTFKVYLTESYKYSIIIAGSNTKISKTHRSLNKIFFSLCLSLCLLQLVLSVTFLNCRVLSFLGHSILQILKDASDHLWHIYFRFLVWKWFSPS